MYCGTITKNITTYRDAYKPGFGSYTAKRGVQKVTYHVYRCDRCQQRHEVLGQADETFGCRACGTLTVGVHEPETNIVTPASGAQIIG